MCDTNPAARPDPAIRQLGPPVPSWSDPRRPWYRGRMKAAPKRSRGRPAVEGDRETLSLRLPIDLHEAVRRHAFEHRQSINSVVVDAVREWVDRQKQGGTRST